MSHFQQTVSGFVNVECTWSYGNKRAAACSSWRNEHGEIDFKFALLTRERSKNVAAALALDVPVNTIASRTADHV